MTTEYQTCPTCLDYAQRRETVLVAALAEKSDRSGESAKQVTDRYMTGIHQRHLSGLPLLRETA